MRKRFLISILVLIAGMGVLGMYAQDKGKEKPLYILDGCFFKERPVDGNLVKGSMSLRTLNGTQAYGLMLKEPLPEDVKQFAIPVEQVTEGDLLLEMYEGQKEMMALSFSSENLLAGDRFPRFEATDIKGRVWTNRDFEGKVMVLNCWYTGCGPCRREMPELSTWKEEMPEVMFFSSTFEKASTAMPVLEKTGFNWIPLVGDKQFFKYIGGKGYPFTVVVDKEGRVALAENGTSPEIREKIKSTIQSLR